MNNQLTDQIKFKAQVNLDDVVNIFVSEYENSLLESKKETAQQLRDQRALLKRAMSKLIADEKSKHSSSTKIGTQFGMILSFNSVDVNVIKNDDLEISTHFKLTYTERSGYQFSTEERTNSQIMTKSKLVVGGGKNYNDIENHLNQLEIDYKEIMSKLKELPSKERAVRGLISKRKLEQSGMSELLEDKEVLKLIQL